jgi:hypothetical protein
MDSSLRIVFPTFLSPFLFFPLFFFFVVIVQTGNAEMLREDAAPERMAEDASAPWLAGHARGHRLHIGHHDRNLRVAVAKHAAVIDVGWGAAGTSNNRKDKMQRRWKGKMKR